MVAFSKSKYQSDALNIHPIRLLPDTLEAAGPVPAAAVNVSISADIIKGKRQYGLGPRGVRASKVFGVAPNTFKKYIFIPVLSKASWGAGNFVVGGEITYKTDTWVIESLTPEFSK